MSEEQEKFRFEIMEFDADIEAEYQCRLEREELERQIAAEKRKKEIEEEARLYRIKVESKGVCEFCGGERPRWVRNGEAYCCYQCFHHDLQCEADVMVPIYRVENMRDYVDEYKWDIMYEFEHLGEDSKDDTINREDWEQLTKLIVDSDLFTL